MSSPAPTSQSCLTRDDLTAMAEAIQVIVKPTINVPKDAIVIKQRKDWLDVYTHPVGEKPKR